MSHSNERSNWFWPTKTKESKLGRCSRTFTWRRHSRRQRGGRSGKRGARDDPNRWGGGGVPIKLLVVLLETRHDAQVSLALGAIVLGLAAQNAVVLVDRVPTKIAAERRSRPQQRTVSQAFGVRSWIDRRRDGSFDGLPSCGAPGQRLGRLGGHSQDGQLLFGRLADLGGQVHGGLPQQDGRLDGERFALLARQQRLRVLLGEVGRRGHLQQRRLGWKRLGRLTLHPHVRHLQVVAGKRGGRLRRTRVLWVAIQWVRVFFQPWLPDQQPTAFLLR